MSKNTFDLIKGSVPFIISMPHNGSDFPTELKQQFLPKSLESDDTDWYLDRLYQFAEELGCSTLKPKYSRYVIDLNRAADGSQLYAGNNNTELCPTTAFNWQKLYPLESNPSKDEISSRIKKYWEPYHHALEDEIRRLRLLYPRVIVFEAHSIASHVERFFEGQLTDFNFGNNDGNSCSDELFTQLQSSLDFESYSSVYNGRFKGGYITRHYGNPKAGVEAIQLELSQATYMNEDKLSWNDQKAEDVMVKLKELIEIMLNWIPAYAGMTE